MVASDGAIHGTITAAATETVIPRLIADEPAPAVGAAAEGGDQSVPPAAIVNTAPAAEEAAGAGAGVEAVVEGGITGDASPSRLAAGVKASGSRDRTGSRRPTRFSAITSDALRRAATQEASTVG